MTGKKKQVKKVEEVKVPEVKKLVTPEVAAKLDLKDLEINDLVDGNKAMRAVRAANGKAKPDTNDNGLAMKGRAEGLKGADLVRFIYKGLGGLVNEKRAAKNRENEEEAKKEKRKK